MQRLPPLRVVNGYWIANLITDGRRRSWGFGKTSKVSREDATKALRLRLDQALSSSDSLTVQKLAALYLEHAEVFYRRSDGQPTGEAANIMYALQPLINLYGNEPAANLRPKHLRAVMDAQAKDDVSRQTINKRLGVYKRMLRWGAEYEHIPVATKDVCQLTSSLKSGRSEAREAKAIRVVPMAQVEQTLPFLATVLQTMVKLQLSSAMRPEEVCSIRMVDIDMSYARCWIYVPLWHKNLHRGIQRRIPIGPIGQELIKPYMVGRAMDQPLFSPREAVRERRGKMPRQRIGFAYDTRSYRQAIWYACDKAFPMPEGADRKAWLREHRWSPNRLRKLSLDGIEQQFGKQAAKAYAGHSRVETTQEFYLTQDDSLARSVAEKVG